MPSMGYRWLGPRYGQREDIEIVIELVYGLLRTHLVLVKNTRIGSEANQPLTLTTMKAMVYN
jgi:hypothetical protein